MSNLKIALAQINTTVGDLEGNCEKILREVKRADEAGCDLVVFCEMTICGYPCLDLWQKKSFLLEIEEKIQEICEVTKAFRCAILVGAPHVEILRNKKESIYNAAFLIEKGEVKKIAHKKSLPNYGVFDEKRYFESGGFLSIVEFRGQSLALLICEDMWDLKNLYLLQEQILDQVIVINASPYDRSKQKARHEIASNFAKVLQKPLIYVNQVGGQDSLVFDGGSFVMDKSGQLLVITGQFEEDFAIVELEKSAQCTVFSVWSQVDATLLSTTHYALSTIYSACVLGLRDYIQKNGFKQVMLGMSGGIDSALAAMMAVDALGSENVFLYALPSRYNSEESMNDAKKCAQNLGVNLEVISIEPAFEAMLAMLRQAQHDKLSVTKENLQARIRGNILMAISNDTGALLLSTGNKSEMAMGYATLYGDMCGAFNPIKDLYKTEIYELVNWRNENIPQISVYQKTQLIPQNIIVKAPTAELRENQKDSDSLPEYEILDKVLYQIIEKEKSVDEIVNMGFKEDLVKKIAKSFYLSEYKRKQSVIGCKISQMSFDLERRYPITNKFRQ